MCQVKCYAFPEYFWGLTLVFNLAGYGVRLPYTCHMVHMHSHGMHILSCIQASPLFACSSSLSGYIRT